MVLQERKIRLSKAVRLRDAFTGEPVSAGGTLRTLSGGRGEKKREGYFLFLDVGSPVFEAEIESSVYQRQKLHLPADSGACVEEILLYPSPAYPLREGVTVVRGRTKPGSVLRFHVRDGQGNVRLIRDYRKGEEEISFYIKDRISGMFWYVWKKGKEEGEYFRADRPGEEGEQYRLKKPLAWDYQKRDTLICPARESIADEEGEFYLLLPELRQERRLLHYACENDGEVTEGELEIVRGRENNFILKQRSEEPWDYV